MPGKRVLVTRAAHQAGKLSEALRSESIEPVEVPVIEIGPPLDCSPLDEALRNLNGYEWLIVTSSNTVRALSERATILGIDLRRHSSLQVAAVGQATAAMARSVGLPVSVIPEEYVAEALVEALRDRVTGKRILLARAEIARDVIPDQLRNAGAHVDAVDAYRNIMPAVAPRLLKQAMERGIDAATFTSSSSVTHLSQAASAAALTFPFPGVPAISIGPITSATLREHGWEPAAEANPSDIPGLVAAVCSWFRRN